MSVQSCFCPLIRRLRVSRQNVKWAVRTGRAPQPPRVGRAHAARPFLSRCVASAAMAPAVLCCLSARPCAGPKASRQLTAVNKAGRPARCRAAAGARADAFGGVSRYFSASPRRGEAVDGEETPARAAASAAGARVAAAADGDLTVEVSALEASLGLGPFTSSATAAIAAMLERADADVAAKSVQVTPARDAAATRAEALRVAVETVTVRATEVTKRTLDENQARAEALVRAPAPT